MEIQPQPPSSWLQSALQWAAIPVASFLTYLVTVIINRKAHAGSVALTSAETRLADANTRHTEAESQQLAWERIDRLHKIIEVKDAELLRLRASATEIEILTGWNRRMKATLTAHNIAVPDKWVSGETKRAQENNCTSE